MKKISLYMEETEKFINLSILKHMITSFNYSCVPFIMLSFLDKLSADDIKHVYNKLKICEKI
jgi:hypothetical protein